MILNMKNQDLDQKIKTLAKQERELLREVLEHFKEADMRRLYLKEKPKETVQKDQSVRLEVTLSKDQWEKLKKARDLASNATQSNDWADLLEYLAEKLIRQKEGSTATVAVKKIVLQRDQCCQFRDKLTGKICGSRWNLHIDHAQPRWAGGSNEKSNLRILCQKHNHHLYRVQAGIRAISLSSL